MKKELNNVTFNEIFNMYTFEDVISILHKENLHIVTVIISQLESSLQKKVLQTFQIDKQLYLLNLLKKMETVKDSVIETITRSYNIQLNKLVESRSKLSNDILIELNYHENLKWFHSLKSDQIEKVWKDFSFNERQLILKIRPELIKSIMPFSNIVLIKIYQIFSKIMILNKSKFIKIIQRIKMKIGRYYE
jgi:Mg/Co/Ni transporter MgtE